MAKQTIDLNSYADGSDLEIQIHQVVCKDETVRAVIYAWLSDKRKKDNQENKAWGWQYCPFDEGDKVTFVRYETKLTAKITSIDKTYYDGDCLVLYVMFDKCSAKKYLKKKSNG